MNSVYKKLFSNFSYLSLFQMISIGAPFIIIPYLIDIYGDVIYGKISWARAIIMFLVILINFGFDLSATRDIAVNVGNKKKKGEIVSTVYTLKFVLTIIGLIILSGLTLISDTVYNERLLLFLTYGWALNELLIPLWYFQGIEKMKMITFLNGGIRIVATIFILIFISEQVSFIVVPLIELISIVIGGGLAVYYVLKKEKRFIIIPTKKMLKDTFSESVGFFFSRSMNVIIEKLNILIIQVVFGFKEVAIFDIAGKITHLMRIPFVVINQAIYPYVNQSKNMKLVKNVILVTLSLAIIGSLIVGFVSPFILNFIIGDYDNKAIVLLYIFIMKVPFTVFSYFIGSTTLVVKGYSKEFNRSVIFGGLFYFVLLGIIYWVTDLNLISLAIILNIVEIGIVGYRYYYVKKFKLLND